jgi:TRAP transporter TAXI family solute receptor
VPTEREPPEAKAVGGSWSRRCVLGSLAGLPLLPGGAGAQETRFFRIGTGSVSGTYYPVGALVADIISSPPGSRPCDRGGNCGVPGLVAVAQSSQGSLDNIDAMLRGDNESGFAQSDIAYRAYQGEGPFAGRPVQVLRALANLYPEALHLVTHPAAGISTVRDLTGKRVSLDRPLSGTRADAQLVLRAFGVAESGLIVEDVGPAEAIDLMKAGELDAFFLVAGPPTAGIAELAEDLGAGLVPIHGPEVSALIRDYPFFAYDLIPLGTYQGIPAVETISVGAQWLATADLETELGYAIMRSFWRPDAREILDGGHPKGRDITLENALDGIAIPLHPGAERFYREAGLMP